MSGENISKLFKKKHKMSHSQSIRQSSTLLDDKNESKAQQQNPEEEDEESNLSQTILVQKLRSEKKQHGLSTTVLATLQDTTEQGLKALEEAKAAEEAKLQAEKESGLINTDFHTEKIHEHVDSQMEKYIREKLEERRKAQLAANALSAPEEKDDKSKGSGESDDRPALTEQSLYVTPSTLAFVSNSTRAAAENESGDRWLTGISEISLPISVKMENYERTERARIELEKKEKDKFSSHLPYNYNANFKGHKEEWGRMMRKRMNEQKDSTNSNLQPLVVSHGIPTAAPVVPSATGPNDNKMRASDDLAIGRFIKRFKTKNFK